MLNLNTEGAKEEWGGRQTAQLWWWPRMIVQVIVQVIVRPQLGIWHRNFYELYNVDCIDFELLIEDRIIDVDVELMWN